MTRLIVTLELLLCLVLPAYGQQPGCINGGATCPCPSFLDDCIYVAASDGKCTRLVCGTERIPFETIPPRRRPSRSTVPEPSVFQSIPHDMWRTNDRGSCPLDPMCPERLDLPYAACRVVAKAITPGQGRGAEGGTWMLPAVDPHCPVDPWPFFVPLDIPIAEFRGDNAAGPWLGAGEVLACRSAVNCVAVRCDAFVVSVFVAGDGPDKPERLWGIRQIVKCWSAVDMDDSFVQERRRVSRP